MRIPGGNPYPHTRIPFWCLRFSSLFEAPKYQCICKDLHIGGHICIPLHCFDVRLLSRRACSLCQLYTLKTWLRVLRQRVGLLSFGHSGNFYAYALSAFEHCSLPICPFVIGIKHFLVSSPIGSSGVVLKVRCIPSISKDMS